MPRLPIFFGLFVFSVSSWAGPFFNLERVRGDANGNTYVVFTASDARSRGQYFPVVLRFLKSGEIDERFGRNGVVLLKDLEGWNQVKIKDLRFGGDGSLYLMGELSMVDTEISHPQPVSAESRISSLFVCPFEAGKFVTRKAFVSKFNPDGTAAVFGRDGTSLLHGLLEHGHDEAVGLGVDEQGLVAVTAKVYRGARKDEALVAMLDASGAAKTDFGQSGMYRVPRPFTPRPSTFEDDYLFVRDPWFDSNKVRFFVNRSTFARRDPERGDAEINYLIDLPVEGHATRIQVERLMSIGRLQPVREDQEPFGTARAVSDDGDSFYLAILPPSVASLDVHLLRYSMASGERMATLKPTSQPELSKVYFRGMQAGKYGVDLYVQPSHSGAMNRLSFDSDLVLREKWVLPEVTSVEMDYRECSQRILERLGDPFAK